MLNTKPSVLVIDGAFHMRQALQFLLRDEFQVLTAPGAMEGQFHLSSHPVDIILLDIQLRDTDGITLLSEIKQSFPYIEIIMITAHASLESIKRAIRFGAYDYLVKPVDKHELLSAARNALKKREAALRIRHELDMLRESTFYLEHLVRNVKNTIINSSENFLKAILYYIHSRDGYTGIHVKRVRNLSSLIADKMGVSDENIQWLKCAAFLHDIGKMNIDANILNKQSTLTDYEYNSMKKHPEKGVAIIQHVPFLKSTIPLIMHHHERYDGSGYPSGLEGKAIPFEARILAVADAIDSMMNSPVRRSPYTIENVKQELQLHASTQFDPEIVDVVIREELLSFA